jgi:flagellar hook-associated protein 1 FlgK
MARLADINVSFSENNLATVGIGEQIMVEGFDVYPLEESDAVINKGELGGLLSAQEKIKNYQEKLTLFRQTLADKVNEVHQQGYTLYNGPGDDFFTLAETEEGKIEIAVNEDILTDPNNIAAALDSFVPGDGRNALAIAGIRERVDFEELGSNSLAGFYRQLVTEIGGAKNQAQQSTANYKLIADQFEAQRQSLSGVSLDEELTLLMQYQYAYQASAQALKVFDDLLDTLINRLR